MCSTSAAGFKFSGGAGLGAGTGGGNVFGLSSAFDSGLGSSDGFWNRDDVENGGEKHFLRNVIFMSKCCRVVICNLPIGAITFQTFVYSILVARHRCCTVINYKNKFHACKQWFL
jgi:hypothetical protein